MALARAAVGRVALGARNGLGTVLLSTNAIGSASVPRKTRPWRGPPCEPLPKHAAGENCHGRGCENDYNPGLRRHCCISLRRASNDTRSASACLRQAGTLCSTTLTAIARAGYADAGTGQG